MDGDIDNQRKATDNSSLPAYARLPLNHCNLPSKILGSLTYQNHPVPLLLDSVSELHQELFDKLDAQPNAASRATLFIHYMTVKFCLDHLEDAGLTPNTRLARGKADYLRVLRGWLFDTECREAAILKGWVESRFGLLPRWHKGPITSTDDEAYQQYMLERCTGIYNTNALDAQLDLLYSYCQYELHRRYPEQLHLMLYRGFNGLNKRDILHQHGKHHYIMLLNNLNSFSASSERADEFGDHVMQARIPLAKVVYYHDLLPGRFKGENEYIVLGGVCEMQEVLRPLSQD